MPSKNNFTYLGGPFLLHTQPYHDLSLEWSVEIELD